MIETISDLLQEIKDKGIERILSRDADITHRPTIGNIYEGLTKEILSKGIFKGLGLKIVLNSFIYNDSGSISDEMDCMVVVGEGKKISFTDQYKYHIADVIAVIQVKKKLFAGDVDEAYLNLRSVKKIAEPRDAEEFVGRLFSSAYEDLTNKPFPSKERIDRFTDRENLVYHLLMMEAFVPLRIVFGYFGYADEFGLREGLVKFMERRVKDGPAKGYSPGSFPNLIICGDSCIVKNNGMPLTIPFKDTEFYWPVLVSSDRRAIYHLLDLLWNRISFKFKIPASQLFDDEFRVSNIHAYLSTKERKLGESSWGWEYYYHEMSREVLQNNPISSSDWKPEEISEHEAAFLVRLQEEGFLGENSEAVVHFSNLNEVAPAEFLTSLAAKRLIYIDESRVGIMARMLSIVCLRGVFYAGDNGDGRMSKWMNKHA